LTGWDSKSPPPFGNRLGPLWKHHPPFSFFSEAPPADSHLQQQHTNSLSLTCTQGQGHLGVKRPSNLPLSLNSSYLLIQSPPHSHYFLYALHATVSSHKRQQGLDSKEEDMRKSVSMFWCDVCFI